MEKFLPAAPDVGLVLSGKGFLFVWLSSLSLYTKTDYSELMT